MTGVRSLRRSLHVSAALSEDSSPCFVTTPIYYVNDKPHIGHVYTSTLADVYARFQRQRGRDVFLLTGTDEHGIKVQRSAKDKGVTPQALADENSGFFRDALTSYGLSFDGFIRTTDESHKKQVQAFVQQLLDQGEVYLGEFEGWYDEGQEEYHTEINAKEMDYKSPINGKPMVRAKEKNYYFKLSAFQDRLEELYSSNPDFIQPPGRRNELLNRIRGGLSDVPVSRTNFSWGVPMPGDEEHVIYVWIDALFNYLTALNMGEDVEGEMSKYWPASVHVMAKEIAWFHAVIWPALLMALNLPLPKLVYAHAFWIRDGQKMSKSLGNFVDLAALSEYVDQYGLDAVRYYLVTEGPIGATDANFTATRLHDIYTSDLVNTLGNCASRTTAMINKYYKDAGVPSEFGAGGERFVVPEYDWPSITNQATEKVAECMEEFDLPGAMHAALGLVQKVDAFLGDVEPYKFAKDADRADELAAVLYQCIETIRIAGVLLESVMPTKMAELAEALGTQDMDGTLSAKAAWGQMKPGSIVAKVALFPRVEVAVEAVTA
eukprot:CAMPEP_0196579280 /NCGR_PEP_ID=MMETSP1081-20130531/19828_1 /TAXON_ID=36882 /ORGANISM="Pyramimonas amylifera, Strain CCMP720" /LENGTH=546 /DNA_ID=CAMNT_0041898813 /DNA_START=231 /DNA_END=1871 /DNA_ORIENTATION=+